jgi:hypothetical protein
MSQEPAAVGAREGNTSAAQKGKTSDQQTAGWRRLLGSRKIADESSSVNSIDEYKDEAPTERWSLGILNDKKTEEVPGQHNLTTPPGPT